MADRLGSSRAGRPLGLVTQEVLLGSGWGELSGAPEGGRGLVDLALAEQDSPRAAWNG